MPSNKELWTLPLPPNLAPLQCARALPAASAVAQAAALEMQVRPGRRSHSALAPPSCPWRAAKPGRRAGREPRAGEGWLGAAAAPFPAQTPLLRCGGVGPRQVRLMPPPSSSAIAPRWPHSAGSGTPEPELAGLASLPRGRPGWVARPPRSGLGFRQGSKLSCVGDGGTGVVVSRGQERVCSWDVGLLACF